MRLKVGQDVTLGLWCDQCMLPSAGRVPIFTVDADGFERSLFGVVNFCTEHGAMS